MNELFSLARLAYPVHCQQTVHSITEFHLHFQIESKQGNRNSECYQAISSEISEELSTNKNKLNTGFDNGFYSKWKILRRLEWWHCLSHKDLIIKSIKTNNY